MKYLKSEYPIAIALAMLAAGFSLEHAAVEHGGPLLWGLLLSVLVVPGLFVNSSADAVDANTTDGLCADSQGRCTLRAAVMPIVQVAEVPEQAPPQPRKLEPASAVAVRVMLVPLT